MFDHTVRGALSPPHTSRAPGFATQDHAQAQDSNADARQHPGHGGHFGKPIKEGVPGLQRGPKARPPRLTYSILRSDCHSQPWIQLTDGYARRQQFFFRKGLCGRKDVDPKSNENSEYSSSNESRRLNVIFYSIYGQGLTIEVLKTVWNTPLRI